MGLSPPFDPLLLGERKEREDSFNVTSRVPIGRTTGWETSTIVSRLHDGWHA